MKLRYETRVNLYGLLYMVIAGLALRGLMCIVQ